MTLMPSTAIVDLTGTLASSPKHSAPKPTSRASATSRVTDPVVDLSTDGPDPHDDDLVITSAHVSSHQTPSEPAVVIIGSRPATRTRSVLSQAHRSIPYNLRPRTAAPRALNRSNPLQGLLANAPWMRTLVSVLARQIHRPAPTTRMPRRGTVDQAPRRRATNRPISLCPSLVDEDLADDYHESSTDEEEEDYGRFWQADFELEDDEDGEEFSYEDGVLLGNLMGPAVPTGLTKAELASLKRQLYTSPDNETCAVCMEPISNSQLAIPFPECSHQLHESCAVSWLAIKAECPVCRAKVVPDRIVIT